VIEKEQTMAKKKAFLVLLGFVFVTIVTADTNRQIFNSWVGYHYTKLGGNIAGRVSYNGNSITYDSSRTVVKERYIPAQGAAGVDGTSNLQSARTESYEVRYEQWVTFYFDRNGIITSWRSYGWKLD
jgi:hypothetical protein